MVNIALRDKNSLINLEVIGKVSIRGKTANSPYFHSPLELLESSLGLCVGGKLIEYCRLNDLNVNIFEQILIDYDGIYFYIKIKKPYDLDMTHVNRLKNELQNCNIANELKKSVLIQWENNTVKTEELLKEKPKSCCGG